jgi:hypothetical protein
MFNLGYILCIAFILGTRDREYFRPIQGLISVGILSEDGGRFQSMKYFKHIKITAMDSVQKVNNQK